MNHMVRKQPRGLETAVDLLLADVAIRIQLSRTNYDLAVSRYEALAEWLDRADSPLHGLVALVYAQGSMAINATIAKRLRTDEFDIDLIAQLLLSRTLTAQQILDLVFEAVRGEKGSRYYDMVERRNRCVTVHYADGMHLDITPAILIEGQVLPRTSVIFHHKPENKSDRDGYHLLANPYGLAEHFKLCTSMDAEFARAFDARASAFEGWAMERADAEPVPEQKGPHQKSRAVIALQLLKRNRNVNYDGRQGRRPPAVMLASLVAEAANQTTSLVDEVLFQAMHIRNVIKQAHDRGQLVHITNPKCDGDVLTDRWPENLNDQALYIADLDNLIAKIAYMKSEKCDLAEMRKIMGELFGEEPTGEVFKAFNQQLGGQIAANRSVVQPLSGAIDLVKSGIAASGVLSSTHARAQTTQPHDFFGEPEE